jgi:tetratricopeptide (TPR) repeat protein
MRRFLVFIVCVYLTLGFGEPLRQKIARGNAHFEKGEYEDALAAYTDAQLHDPHSPSLFFNMGDVLYSQRKYDEAIVMYEKTREKGDHRLESQALYNSGCTLYRQGKLKESLDMFKEALAKDPNDEDAKYNVEFVEQKIKEMLDQAQKRMEQEQQQSGSAEEQKNEQSTGQGSEQNTEEKKDEQPADAAQAETKEEDDKEKQAGEAGKSEEPQAPAGQDKSDQQDKAETSPEGQASGKEMSKEEAERYLDMLAMDDKMQQPAQEQPRSPYGNYRLEKDW